MKILIIIPLFLLLFSCNSTGNNSQLRKDNTFKKGSDTIVGVQVVPADLAGSDYIKKEYFVVIKSDTSSCSCIITENRITGKVTMHYRHDPYGKIPYSFSLNDTAAVAKEVRLKKSIKKLNYKDQIKELKLMLSRASKDFNLSKLHDLSFAMSSVGELSPSVTRQYLSKYGEKFPYGGNRNAADIIKSSKLTEDLNKALVPYSLIIDKISIDGLAYYTPQDSPKETRALLNGIVIFSLIALR